MESIDNRGTRALGASHTGLRASAWLSKTSSDFLRIPHRGLRFWEFQGPQAIFKGQLGKLLDSDGEFLGCT